MKRRQRYRCLSLHCCCPRFCRPFRQRAILCKIYKVLPFATGGGAFSRIEEL